MTGTLSVPPRNLAARGKRLEIIAYVNEKIIETSARTQGNPIDAC